MFFQVFCLLTITGCYQIQCYVSVPLIYRQAELALHRYSSNKNHNPVVYSLLNILIHDKRAKAFVSNAAIEQSLKDVNIFNKHDQSILHELIHSTDNPIESNEISTPLKEHIESVLDTFFIQPDIDYFESFDLPSDKKRGQIP